MAYSSRALGLLVFLISVPAFAEVPITPEAREHFTAGVNLLQDPDGARYEDAYREFHAAYAASPSWKILGNLGLSAMKLERDGEAISAYKQYLAEGGAQIEADERAQFQRDLATLQAGVVEVSFDSTPAGALIEDLREPTTGSPIRNTYGPLSSKQVLGVRAGRHRFTAQLPGHQEAVWVVELAPRQRLSHSFELPQTTSDSAPPESKSSPAPAMAPQAPSGSGLRVASYVAFGVGAVGVGAGAFFAVTAKSKFADANQLVKDRCGPSGDCSLMSNEYQRWKDLGDQGSSAKTLSLVSFIVGGVGVATGVTLLALSSGKHDSEQSATVEPLIGLGNLGLRGSF